MKREELTIEEKIGYIKDKLCKTKRDGIKKLVTHMEETGFFEAPCSGGNHLCCPHGLAAHTYNVMVYSEAIAKTLLSKEEFQLYKDSITICAALHDLGKAGQHGKPYYTPNLIKDGRPTKADPIQRYKISESKPYEQNKDLLKVDHCIRSIVTAQQFIELTEEEQFAILYHDGLYGAMKYEINGNETKLQLIIHQADLWVCRFEEGKSLTNPETQDTTEFEME